MKIRNGLVSNSSSSSFVFIGYKITFDFMDKDQVMSIANKLVSVAPQKVQLENDDFQKFLYDLVNLKYNFDILPDLNNSIIYMGYLVGEFSKNESTPPKEIKDLEISEKIDNTKEILKTIIKPSIFIGQRTYK